MTTLKLLLCAGAATLGLASASAALADDQTTAPAAAPAPAAAAPAAPAASPAPYPAMTAPLAANPNPAVFDAGPLGKITVDGVLSGTGFYQTDPQRNYFGRETPDYFFDVSNAQVIINKTDGPVQFYIQAGSYSITALGASYLRSTTLDKDTFGYVPQGFLKLVPNSNFSVEVGALPTLIGDEYTFSFENMNIERGLLWGQEPAVSKGVQLNYATGPWSMSAAVTDGYYTGDYTSISGLLTYTFKDSDTLTFAAEGNAGQYRNTSYIAGVVSAPEQANGQIYNLIYSHSSGPWTITPYFQYSSSPYIAGISSAGDTYGGAILTKYNFTPEISLSGRFEYVASDGAANLLGYGVGSSAVSITVTPGYQKGIFFARAELSYTDIINGSGFGPTGTGTDQVRVLGEAGLMF